MFSSSSLSTCSPFPLFPISSSRLPHFHLAPRTVGMCWMQLHSRMARAWFTKEQSANTDSRRALVEWPLKLFASVFDRAVQLHSTHGMDRFYLRHEGVTRKMTMIVSNVSVCYTFFREREIMEGSVADFRDYHCHLSRHPFVTQIKSILQHEGAL